MRSTLDQSYFDRDSMWHTEIPAGVRGYNQGIAGDAVPYSIATDNVMSVVLLLCFVFAFIAIAKSHSFIAKQANNFFYTQHNSDTIAETSNEVRFQVVMSVINILMIGIVSYVFATQAISQDYLIQNNYLLMALLVGIVLAFLAAKWLVMLLVNTVFFDGKKNAQWIRVKLFLFAWEGALMLPLVFLLIYFNIPAKIVLFSLGFILILNKLLTFYKCWSIFFKQNGGFLQTFLYFCALEITPLLAFCGAWLTTINILKIKF